MINFNRWRDTLMLAAVLWASLSTVAAAQALDLSVPDDQQRNIKMAEPELNRLQAFTATNAGLPEIAGSLAHALTDHAEPLAGTVSWQQRLEYLRGSSALEGELRPRTSILGEIAAAQGVLVQGARYLASVANRLEGNNTYSDFVTQTAQRRAQLYVGGQDGFLHAFDARSAAETFAFIPSSVLPHLLHSTTQQYRAGDYRMGRPAVADVYDGQQWRTILVSSVGAGGSGLFALDITHPDAIELLWELDEHSSELATQQVKLGYSFAQPSIARLHHGGWAVVTGNGYQAQGSEQGAAALYVIDALKGTLIKSLEVQSDLARSNGLSAPRLADYDGDGVADYAYAGDVHGNLWRFDLLGDGAYGPDSSASGVGYYGAQSGSRSGFKVSYAGKPLFTATTAQGVRQPITAAPSLVAHPTGKGYLVIVGTGQDFELPEGIDPAQLTHSLYGIWDRHTAGQSTGASTVSRAQLALQNITQTTVGVSQDSGESSAARVISNHTVQWHTGFDTSAPIQQRGWVLDLQADGAATGEMLVDNMRSLGSMLLVQTQVSSGSAAQHWLYALNPTTGGATAHQALAIKSATASLLSAIKFTPAAPGSGIQLGERAQSFVVQGRDTQVPIAAPPQAIGRQSWRRISND